MAQLPCFKGSWAIYPPFSFFDIDGATQDSAPSTLSYEYIYIYIHMLLPLTSQPLDISTLLRSTVYSPHRDLAVVAQRLRVRRSPGSWSATKRHLPCARQGASTKHKLTGWNFRAVKKAHLIELCLRLFWRQCKNWFMQQVHFWEKVQVLPAEPNALVQLR